MARIAGVKLDKTSSGKINKVTFDLKKHGDIINPILEQLGVIEPDKEKEEFMKEFNAGMSGDEFWGGIKEHIKTLPWKK